MIAAIVIAALLIHQRIFNIRVGIIGLTEYRYAVHSGEGTHLLCCLHAIECMVRVNPVPAVLLLAPSLPIRNQFIALRLMRSIIIDGEALLLGFSYHGVRTNNPESEAIYFL